MTAAADRADRLAAKLAKLSRTAGRRATEALNSAFTDAQLQLTTLWVRRFGSVSGKPKTTLEMYEFLAEAATILRSIATVEPDTDPLAAAWRAAYALGLEHAIDTVPHVPDRMPRPDPPPPVDLSRPVVVATSRAVTSLDVASIERSGFVAVQSALTTARVAVSRVEAAAAYHVTAAAAEAVRDMAREVGAQLIWVAERDGCVHCLAYSGQTTATEVFPHGLTFGDRPIRTASGPLTGPPLHAHCRCTLECWDPSDTAVVTALKREARRSVVRGLSLPSESEPARLRAADRLLANGAGLPKTVEEFGRRAVRAGKFPTRRVP